jgi:hypothetical protein
LLFSFDRRESIFRSIESESGGRRRSVGQLSKIAGGVSPAIKLIEQGEIDAIDLRGQIAAFGIAQLLPKNQKVLLAERSEFREQFLSHETNSKENALCYVPGIMSMLFAGMICDRGTSFSPVPRKRGRGGKLRKD